MDNKITGFLKKRMYYIIGVLIVALVVFIGISFAFFTQVLKSESDVIVKTGDLVVTFNNGNTINGDFIPTNDSIGMTQDGYNFTVSNNGSLNASYKVELYTDPNAKGTTVPHKYLMVSFNGGAAKPLSTFAKSLTSNIETENVYLLGTNNLGKNSQSNIIRVWIKNDAPKSVIGNKVALKVKVTSEVGNS